jgi:hypothetical protein
MDTYPKKGGEKQEERRKRRERERERGGGAENMNETASQNLTESISAHGYTSGRRCNGKNH